MRKILYTTVAAGVLYSAAWYALTDHLQKQTETFVTQLEHTTDDKIKARFTETEKFGFPFRLGVRLKDVQVRVTLGNTDVDITPQGGTYELSTTLPAKVFTLEEDGKEGKQVFSINKKTVLEFNVLGHQTFALGFKNSPLWSSLMSDGPSTLHLDFEHFKAQVLEYLQTLTPDKSFDPFNAADLREYNTLVDSLMAVLSHFESYKVNGQDSLYRYAFSPEIEIPKDLSREGVLMKFQSFDHKATLQLTGEKDLKGTMTTQQVALEEDLSPVVLLVGLLIEKNPTLGNLFPREVSDGLWKALEARATSMALTSKLQGPNNKDFSVAFHLGHSKVLNRAFALENISYKHTNTLEEQTFSGFIRGTHGSTLKVEMDMEGQMLYKDTMQQAAPLMLAANMKQVAESGLLPDGEVEGAMTTLFEGVETLGPLRFKSKGQFEVAWGDSPAGTPPSPAIDAYFDDFYIQSDQYGGIKVTGKFSKDLTLDGTLTFVKVDTLIDGLSQKAGRVLESFAKKAGEAPFQISDDTVKTVKDFLKALDTQDTKNENAVITVQFDGTTPQFSGKNPMELIFLWNMASSNRL